MDDTMLDTAQTNTDAGQGDESTTGDLTMLEGEATEAKAEGTDESQQVAAEETGDKGEGEKSEQDGEKEDGESLNGAPEAYESFELPDGVSLEGETLDGFQGLAKELNLSQAGAQKLVDYEAERLAGMAEQQEETMRGAVTQQLKDWADAMKSDKEFGGDKLKDSLETARLGMKAYAEQDPELADIMANPLNNPKGLGLGNHPAMIRLFARIGKEIGEDVPGVSGGDGEPTEADRLAKLYPSMKQP